MRLAPFSGKSSGIVRPSWARVFLLSGGYVVEIALLDRWYCRSLMALLPMMVFTPTANTWPGTSVSVVATPGNAMPTNRPPSSRVSLRSCV